MKKLIQSIFLLTLCLMAFQVTYAQDVKKVDVSVSDKDGYKKVTIRKHLEDGSIDVVNWEGTGEIPEEIKKEMGKGGNVFIYKDENKLEIIGGEIKDRLKTKNVEVIVSKIKNSTSDSDEEREVNVWVSDSDEDGELNDNEVKIVINGEPHIVTNGLNSKSHVVIVTTDDTGTEKTVKVKVQADADGDESVEAKKESFTRKAVPTIERSLALKDFQMSPNPASDNINVRFNSPLQSPITIRAIDAQGRQVYKEYIRNFDGFYDQNIDLRDVNVELLFISIEQEGKVYTDKVIVKKQ